MLEQPYLPNQLPPLSYHGNYASEFIYMTEAGMPAMKDIEVMTQVTFVMKNGVVYREEQ
ncbi:MAG: hypothetical protein AAFU03_06595 [Bacteroidota bacterium]